MTLNIDDNSIIPSMTNKEVDGPRIDGRIDFAKHHHENGSHWELIDIPGLRLH